MKSKPTPGPSSAPASPASVHPLERRLLLAGHIDVFVKEGFLYVNGDKAANDFTVTTAGLGTNQIKVTAASGTTINKGKTEITLTKFTKSIRIDAGAGDDTIRVNDAKTAAGLSIYAADGNDTVLLEKIDLGAKLYVSTGAGNDVLSTKDGQVFNTTEIHMGAGNDIIDCAGTKFVHRFSAKLGSGNDTFTPGDAKFQKENRFVDGQGGRDVVLEGKSLSDFTFSFAKESKGWNGGISDYDRADQDDLEKKQEIRSLPTELSSSAKGFYLSSNNLSDDVFQFIKRKISGLKKNTNYMVRFDVTFASNTPTGMIAVGGRPADDVFVKVGGSTAEPTTTVNKKLKVRVNLDKGANDKSGKDMTILSTAGNGTNVTAAGSSQTYKSVTQSAYHANPIKTDKDGNLWLAVGTDSGFEGTTAIFIQSITVRLLPVG
jgi:hypothetical protein